MCIKLWKRERVFKSIPKCSHIEVKISNWYLGNWGKCTAKESLWTVGKTWVIVKKRGNRNSISQRVHWWFFFFFQFFPPLKSLFSFSHPPPPHNLCNDMDWIFISVVVSALANNICVNLVHMYYYLQNIYNPKATLKSQSIIDNGVGGGGDGTNVKQMKIETKEG